MSDFADLAAKARSLQLIDPEEAAVFVADESRHPYDVDAILTEPQMYRRCLRLAQRYLPDVPALHARLAEAKQSLDWTHQL